MLTRGRLPGARRKPSVTAMRLRVIEAYNAGQTAVEIAIDEGVTKTTIESLIVTARQAGYTVRRYTQAESLERAHKARMSQCQSADDAKPDA